MLIFFLKVCASLPPPARVIALPKAADINETGHDCNAASPKFGLKNVPLLSQFRL
jgi:hypothetical protein